MYKIIIGDDHSYHDPAHFAKTGLVFCDDYDKVGEIMMNHDNLESNLLTSSLLKKTSGLHTGTS